MNGPRCITVLNDQQRTKNDLIDRVREFRQSAYTRTSRFRNEHTGERRFLSYTAFNLGYQFDGFWLWHTAEKDHRVGKTPIRFDYSDTETIHDNPQRQTVFDLLNQNQYIHTVKLSYLRPSEIKNGLVAVMANRKNRLTYEMMRGVDHIVKTDTITLKSNTNRPYAETTLPWPEFKGRFMDKTESYKQSSYDLSAFASCQTPDIPVPF